MLCRGTFWLVLLLVPTLSVLLDYVVIYSRLIFKPTPIDIAVEFDRCTREPRLDHQLTERGLTRSNLSQFLDSHLSQYDWMAVMTRLKAVSCVDARMLQGPLRGRAYG